MKLSLFIISFVAFHSCAYGGFKDKLKNRLMDRMQKKPAPEASSEISSPLNSSGTYTFRVKHQDLDRYYIVHVPKKYSPNKAAPLLLAFHGGGGNMKIQAEDKYYKQISKSEELGFIVVFPNGYSRFQSGALATWNAGACCGDARDKKIDDVGFIKLILENVKKQLNIDSKKIFATGMSNGGLMSYRLACELSSDIKAIAAVAGTDNTLSCTPLRKVSILHIHAKDDDHVLINGGIGPSAADEEKITKFTSVADTLKKWKNLNGCSDVSKKIIEKKHHYCEQWNDCKEGTKIQLCVTDTGGHSWPGGRKPRGKDQTFKDLSANDAMWDFFNSL